MPRKQKVLLIGWDAADWKVISPLVDQGLMPHTAALIANGVMGNLATLNPILSPMLWTSIATGKRPYKHGIHGFSEPDPQTATVRPITNLSRKTKAIWNILNQHAKKSLVVGWWPSSPAEPINGVMVSNHYQQAGSPLGAPWPVRPGTIYPEHLTEELASLRVHPHELGGDSLRYFVPRAPEIDQEKDKRLEQVAKILAESSGIQAAATHLMRTQSDWDFAAVYFDGIDHFGHGFMRYHPPRLDWIDESDFEMYRGVINGGYIFHDMMLGKLLSLAGPETNVILVSDHGFHPDHLRPKSLPNEPAGPAAEHRQFGIFLASGPGIKKDELVFGASLLDIAPTILTMFDLPVGRDMDGRVLDSIFSNSVDPKYIDSWDSVQGDDGRHPPETQISSSDSMEAIQQLVDLGYIDEPDADNAKAIDETQRELDYNLARAYLDGGKCSEAAELFALNWERWPEESRFGVHLLQAQMLLEDPLKARATMTLLKQRKQEAMVAAANELKELIGELQLEFPAVEDTSNPGAVLDNGESSTESPSTLNRVDWQKVPAHKQRMVKRLRSRVGMNPHAFSFLEGSLLHMEGRYDAALEALANAVEAQTSNLPDLYLKMGDVCRDNRDWDTAEAYYRKVVELDELNARSHFGLARVAVHRRDWKQALREAQTSAGQFFHYAPSHYIAGLAHARLGNPSEALTSLRRAVAINPAYPQAHRTLASVLQGSFGDENGFLRHLRLSRDAKHVKEPRSTMVVDERQNLEKLSVSEVPPKASWEATEPDLPSLEESIVIVTGLPRSGTSMMMQMLIAGGVPVFADDHRPADESNPRGYYEHQHAKTLMTDSSWLGESVGRAVKVVVQLLRNLSAEHHYRVVFMHRPLEEVVSSQRKMLARLGKRGAAITAEALKETFRKQLTQARSMLEHFRRRGRLDILDLHYHEVLSQPDIAAQSLSQFLGTSFDVDAAENTVDASLNHESKWPKAKA